MYQFSAYWLDPSYGWMATHRLPLDSAIMYCKEYRRHEHDCPVALVPDREDPAPFLQIALGCSSSPPTRTVHLENALYGHCDTCGAPCDRLGCLVSRNHEPALA